MYQCVTILLKDQLGIDNIVQKLQVSETSCFLEAGQPNLHSRDAMTGAI